MTGQHVGVTVPMDPDAINPGTIAAASAMGIGTLAERAERRGQFLDWDTMTISIDPNTKGLLVVAERL